MWQSNMIKTECSLRFYFNSMTIISSFSHSLKIEVDIN